MSTSRGLVTTELRMAARAVVEQRSRAVSVLVAAFLMTTAVLLAASAFQVRGHESDRLDGRTGFLSETPADSDTTERAGILALATTEPWGDQIITIVSIEAMGSTPVTPPGVDALPAVGDSVISPALAEAVAADPSVEARFGESPLIAPAGMVNRDELLAYRVVPSGTLSGDGDAILHAENGDYSGEGPVLRIAGFASDPASHGGLPIVVGLSDGVLQGAWLGAYLSLVLLAGVILAVVALALKSESRDRRLALLQFLGVPRGQRIRVVIGEALISALPGVLLALVAWTLVSRSERVLVGSGHRVMRGDAVLPLWQWALCGLAVIVLIAAIAAVLAVRVTRPVAGRPRVGRRALSRWAVLPAAGSVGLFAAALTMRGTARADVAFVASALAVVAVPLLVPTLLRSVGQRLRRRREPAVWLSGAVMEHNPGQSARPFAGIAALILLTVTSAGYVAAAQFSEDPPGSHSGPQAVSVEWRGGSPTALDDLAAALPESAVLQFVTEPLGDAPPIDGPTTSQDGSATAASPGSATLVVDTDCADLVAQFDGLACGPNGMIEGPQSADLIAKLGSVGHGEMIEQVRAVAGSVDADSAGNSSHRDAVVLGEGSALALERDVRQAAADVLPVVNISGISSSVKTPSALIPWIRSGLVIAAALLAIACLMSVRDRFFGIIGQHHVLDQMGLGAANFRRLTRSLFAVPFGVAAATGLVLGTLACIVHSDSVGVPWGWVAAIAGCVAVGGIVTAAWLPRVVVPIRTE